jgi:hypothetical protein
MSIFQPFIAGRYLSALRMKRAGWSVRSSPTTGGGRLLIFTK